MWVVSFWVFPVISALMWLAMLLAMIGSWGADGAHPLSDMNGGKNRTIPFISDIGAEALKPLFITGGTITSVFLDLSFLCERWLRHAGQLAPNRGFLDKSCAVLSILFGIAGAAGLILLSIFDTERHPKQHSGFIILFLVGYLISAILICVEYLRMGLWYRSRHRILLVSFGLKTAFVVIEVALAIAWVCSAGRSSLDQKNAAAVLEWVVAYVFTFYILSFAVDLFPSIRTRRHIPQGEKDAHDVEETVPPAAIYQEPLSNYQEPYSTYDMETPTSTNGLNSLTGSYAPNFYRGQHIS